MLGGKRLLVAGIALAALYWVVQSSVDAFVFGQNPFVDELLLFPTDEFGHELWIRLLTMSFLIAFGAVLQAVHNRRQRDLERLRESEERSSALLSAVPDLMFRVSPEGEYLDFQSNQYHLLYVPKEERLGRKVHDVLPSGLADRCLQGIGRARTWRPSRPGPPATATATPPSSAT